MYAPHEPREEFVERLASAIGSEVRRRNRAAEPRRWLAPIGLKTVAALATVVLLSMAIGGAAVAVAYQTQNNERRDLIASVYERRADLARQRLAIARAELESVTMRASIGTGTQIEVLEARLKVKEAEAQITSVELQLAEVRLTGREPLNEVSSPVVNGRDFVTERWQVELEVPQASLELERRRLGLLQQRLEMGMASRLDVDIARAKISEIESAIRAVQRKLEIRREFVARRIDATLADLRVVESGAEERRLALLPRIENARQELGRIAQRIEIGLAQPVERAEAALRLNELETELAKADLDLALARRQIEQRRSGK